MITPDPSRATRMLSVLIWLVRLSTAYSSLPQNLFKFPVSLMLTDIPSHCPSMSPLLPCLYTIVSCLQSLPFPSQATTSLCNAHSDSPLLKPLQGPDHSHFHKLIVPHQGSQPSDIGQVFRLSSETNGPWRGLFDCSRLSWTTSLALA